MADYALQWLTDVNEHLYVSVSIYINKYIYLITPTALAKKCTEDNNCLNTSCALTLTNGMTMRTLPASKPIPISRIYMRNLL